MWKSPETIKIFKTKLAPMTKTYQQGNKDVDGSDGTKDMANASKQLLMEAIYHHLSVQTSSVSIIVTGFSISFFVCCKDEKDTR